MRSNNRSIGDLHGLSLMETRSFLEIGGMCRQVFIDSSNESIAKMFMQFPSPSRYFRRKGEMLNWISIIVKISYNVFWLLIFDMDSLGNYFVIEFIPLKRNFIETIVSILDGISR